MSTYKITNITNFAGKRDSKFNMTVDIEYVDNRTKKVINLKAGDSVYLTVQSLPLSVHRLRIKNLITVSEASPAELAKSIEASKPPKVAKPKAVKKSVPTQKKVEEVVEVDEKTTSSKKKTVKE